MDAVKNPWRTTVDASQFEQVVAALMIVGKAELAEIMALSRGPSPYDQRHEGHKCENSSPIFGGVSGYSSASIKSILNAVIVIVVLVWLLKIFGLWSYITHIMLAGSGRLLV
jgi:hypothetical protein